MSYEKTICRYLTKHRRLGIVCLALRRLQFGPGRGAAALIVDANVAESHVFNIMTGDAANDRGVARVGVIDNHVADNDTSQLAGSYAFWSAHAAAKPKKDG